MWNVPFSAARELHKKIQLCRRAKMKAKLKQHQFVEILNRGV
jgi:hypothetical protein